MGPHKITVGHADYGKAEKTVEISEGLTAVAHFDLQPKKPAKEVKKELKEPTVEIKGADGYHGRGFSYFAKNQIDLAIADFTRALELDSNYMVAYYNRGVAFFDLGQNERAITDFTKAMELGLRGKGPYHVRGLAYAKQGQYDLAIADFNKALEIDPKDAASYNNRGISYLLKGQYKRTISDLTRAIELDSKNAAFYHFHLGFAMDKTGDKELARHNFFKAREMDKDIIKKNSELLEKTANPETKRFYAEEILAASQYIGVQPQIEMKAREILEKTPPEPSLPPSQSSPENRLVKIFSQRFLLIIVSLLLVLGILLVLVIKLSPKKRKEK
jgi:tetratricopeptide (TPR) repeat protein